MSDPVVRRLDVASDGAFVVLRRLAQERQEAGERGQLWVVGGYVRDHLLGLGSDPDLDLVCVGWPAAEAAARFAELAGAQPPVVFERFGTAQVSWGARVLEFVSARRESYRDDSRKPEVREAALEEDLARRDFTVNALYADLDGGVRDPFAGIDDLTARVLRTPREPLETFHDDPLRMLRGVRFAATLDFQLSAATAAAIEQEGARLEPPVVSWERIAGELFGMLTSARPRRALELLDELGLLPRVLPELAATHGVQQGGYHEDDVFGHTLRTVELTRQKLNLRLAALFHDLGKPATAAPDGGFPGHEEVGAEIATAALERLRVSGSRTRTVARLVRLHLRPVYYDPTWTDGAVRRLVRAAGSDLDLLLELARADVEASSYPHPEKIDELRERVRSALEERPDRFALPLSGDDIMFALSLEPGPEVGRIKAELEGLVLDGVLPPDHDALLGYLRGRGYA